MNHTPGPWKQEHRKGDDGMYRTQVFSKKYGTIATLHWTPQNLGNGVTGTYREANARLIAAAPELYRCLQRLEIAFSNRPTSENEAFWEAWADIPGITTAEVRESCLIEARAAIAKAEGKS